MRTLIDYLRTTPLWLLAPTLALLATTAFAASGYEPLVFDASLYDVEQAQAAELQTVDAAAIEAQNAQPVETDPAAAVDGSAVLSDGTWTGYAPCGVGNPDGWKPYYVAVTIQVADGAVTGITGISGTSHGNAGGATLNWDAAENQSYLTKAAGSVRGQIESAIAVGSTTTSIDTVSGATYSSASIYNAYVDALNKAGGGAGSASTMATPSSSATDEAPKTMEGAQDDDASIDELADGTWTGYAACGVGNTEDWKPYYVATTLKVKKGKIVKISKIIGTSTGDKGNKKLSWDAAENQTYLTWALEGRTRGSVTYKGVRAQLDAAIAVGKTPTSIDAVSGATYSSEAAYHSYFAALKKSAAAAGSKVEEPASGTVEKPTPPPASPEPEAPEVPVVDEDLVIPDGVYEGYALCEDKDAPTAYAPYYIFVEIEASGGRITTIRNVYGDAEGKVDSRYLYDAHENASYLNKAILGAGLFSKGVKTQIQEKLDAGETVTGIDTISGATWSSRSIFEAYVKAVAAAVEAAQAALNPESPVPDEDPSSPSEPASPKPDESDDDSSDAKEDDSVQDDAGKSDASDEGASASEKAAQPASASASRVAKATEATESAAADAATSSASDDAGARANDAPKKSQGEDAEDSSDDADGSGDAASAGEQPPLRHFLCERRRGQALFLYNKRVIATTLTTL